MKDKDLSSDSEAGKKGKKDHGTKKLGDKIGPANNHSNREEHSNDSKKDRYRDPSDENRDGGK